MDRLLDSMRKVALFANLPNSIIVELSARLERIALAQDAILFQEGAVGDGLFVVNEGKIKVVSPNDLGEEVVLNQFGPGDSFGEMSLVDGAPRSATAVALIRSEVYKLQRSDFLELFARYPDLGLGIIRDLSGKLRFAAAYIQKATEWSRYIAEGQYDEVAREIENTQSGMASGEHSDEARASALLSAFFQMVQDVREREETFKREMQELRIQIDEAKRAAQVVEITETDYFQKLQRQARELRAKKGDLSRQQQPDHAAAERYAFDRLARELAVTLGYHNVEHSRDDVLPAALRLADLVGLSEPETQLLRVAASFHDLGYIVQMQEHERIGADIATQVLPGFGFGQAEIDAIVGMIMATRLPQSPRTLLEELLADADLDVLGREDFMLKNSALRRELETFGVTYSDTEWHQQQLQFLETHRYFSQAARQLRDAAKERNSQELRTWLAKNMT